jgi:ATP/maltotriose-dependent transcriptional regulator MalT
VDDADAIEQGRAAFVRRAWSEAHRWLSAADAEGSLGPEDLQRLAVSGFLTGRDESAEDAWARAHQAFFGRGEVEAAVRCAFWLGMVLITGQGDEVRGGGWIARAHRLVEDSGLQDNAVRGYVLLPAALRELDAGDPGLARDVFVEAAEIGQRFHEADLVTLARLGQAQSLIRMDEARYGAELLDEVMVEVEGDRVSPLTAGIVYCAVILACQQIFDLPRAQAWTRVLSRWCDEQPDLVRFRGTCLVHRSELAAFRGDWDTAVAEADRACRRLADPPDPAVGSAWYQRAELHRMKGQLSSAETAYEHAATRGHDPHPGLALLWLAQDRTEVAAAAIRRVIGNRGDAYPGVVDEVAGPRPRAEMLAAAAEILVAAGDLPAAGLAADELQRMAEVRETPLLTAVAARALGTVLLARHEPAKALEVFGRARRCWAELQAPYEAARNRVLVARALRALGDDDTASIEERAAAEVFRRVGASLDLKPLEAPGVGGASDPVVGLTPREIEVVRLVATGRTNREIADELVISGKTVARHLHNVFTKLDLPNRSAATAWAYEHDLV